MVLSMPGRLIDQDERTRQKPMRVLVLGMCRTGTTTISVALRKLGYTPHQMRQVLQDPKELALWQEAINVTLLPPQDRPTKHKNHKPYDRPEFDKLLGNYDVVMDIPGCIFAKELIEAYPDAKVILTTRDYAAWETSMQASIWCLCTWQLFTMARYFNITQMAPLVRLMHSTFRVHNGNNYGGPEAKAAYEKHYDTVSRLVPSDQLLEIQPDTTTWEPLCEFLGQQVPKDRFPQMKDESAMQKYLENAWWGMVKYLAFLITMPGAIIVLAVVAYNYIDVVRGWRDEYILFPIGRFLKD